MKRPRHGQSKAFDAWLAPLRIQKGYKSVSVRKRTTYTFDLGGGINVPAPLGKLIFSVQAATKAVMTTRTSESEEMVRCMVIGSDIFEF